MEISPFLKSLISTSGLSGYETPVRDRIETAWRPLTDELHLSRLGSLHGLRRGTGPEPRPGLLLAAHMDAVGLMVSAVEGEFLRVTQVGYLDPRVLPGQLVTVHGRRELPGVLVQLPPPSAQGGSVSLGDLLVDVGLTSAEVRSLARIGDLVSFAQPPLEMGADLLGGHSLDNRASVAALTVCLELLHDRALSWDVWAAATVLEEENFGGGLTSAFQLRPAVAVAIDVTFGASPGSPSHSTFPLGGGLTLGWGPNIHPGLYQAFQGQCERLEIPYRMEVMPRDSGTEAMAMQIAAEGIPTMVVSIPLRYMHTPVEVVSLKDIGSAARLLAEFAAGLDENFLSLLQRD